MGDHCKAARLVHQVDAAIHLDRVAVNMRWTTIGQEAIECLLPITNMACLDQRVSDMWATDRGTFADLGHHLRFATGTKLRQLREDTGQAGPAGRRVLEPSQRPGQDSPDRRRTPGRAHCCRDEQESSIRVPHGPLAVRPPRLLHPGRRRCRDQSARRRPARLHEPAHELGWRVRTVGDQESMEVDPHASDLSHRTALILTTGPR